MLFLVENTKEGEREKNGIWEEYGARSAALVGPGHEHIVFVSLLAIAR